MALIRLVVISFVVMTVIYWSLSLYSRSLRREKLEDEWDEDHPGEGETPARDAYIEKGMQDYQSGLRPKLILLVYILPAVLIIGTFIAVNLS